MHRCHSLGLLGFCGWWLTTFSAGCSCGPSAKEITQQQLNSLSAPGRTLGVTSFTDNNNLDVLAQMLFPEVLELLDVGVEGNGPLLGVLNDAALDGTADGDQLRALVAYVLEKNGSAKVLPQLRDYAVRGLQLEDPPFFSLQATAHAMAVLSGQTALIRGLYNRSEVEAFAASTISTPLKQSPLKQTTRQGRDIGHQHLIGPDIPPAWWKDDWNAEQVADRREFWEEKKDGIAQFEDPILILEDATRSYDCHSFTFARADTQLEDLHQRYHIEGESVPTLLEDEGYVDITSTPSQWRPGDAVVFHKALGGVPTHTGRLSSGGSSLTDPQTRFTSKWSVHHPVVNVSIRDCMKLYGRIATIWRKVEQCAVEIRAGGYTSCARRSDGTVWCWGNNASGQLGNGSTQDSATPVQVSGLGGVASVSVGQSHACAVKGADGSVWCWGDNSNSQLGVTSATSSTTPVQVTGVTGATRVATSLISSCALTGTGQVWCWGDGAATPKQKTRQGAAPNDPPAPLLAVELTGGYGGFGALATDGSLWGWNSSLGGFPGCGSSNWVSGPGSNVTIAEPVQTQEGSLSTPPTPLTGATRAPTVGRLHACSLMSSGGVSCWGVNEHGQLGRTTAGGGPFFYPAAVEALSGVIDFAASEEGVCARLTDGKVSCWGKQADGSESMQPVALADSDPVPTATSLSIAGGANHACALTSNGAACWGDNLFGQLGTGQDSTTLSQSTKPLRVALPCP